MMEEYDVMSKDVSVVVVAKNEENNIANCLTSIINQNYPQELYEIIVVDGGSTDKTQEIIKNFPVKLIVDTYGTIGHQRNTGITNSKGDFIAFTDADCVVDSSWLSALVRCIKNSPTNVVAVGGPNLVMPWDFEFAKVVGYSQETFLGSGGSAQSANSNKRLPKVQSIPNCNAIYKKDYLLHEKYNNDISIGEDAELNYRLNKKGFRFFYDPSAVVWHKRAPSLGKFANKMFNYGRALGRLTKHHKAIIRWYAILPPACIVLAPVCFIMRILFNLNTFDNIVIAFLSLYLLGLSISTIQVWSNIKNANSLWTPILLNIQHFAYGLGFIKGISERGVSK